MISELNMDMKQFTEKQRETFQNRAKYGGICTITPEYLTYRKILLIQNKYPVAKWIMFCETMLANGWHVSLCDARHTDSKYVTIKKRPLQLKIRFSNHKANVKKELVNDSDYYVGIGNFGVITTEQVIHQIFELDRTTPRPPGTIFEIDEPKPKKKKKKKNQNNETTQPDKHLTF